MSSLYVCICRGKETGQQIVCKSADRPIKSYQLKCLGITQEPPSNWVCPRCRLGIVEALPSSAVTSQEASPSQRNTSITGAQNVTPRRRKSQRTARVIYESTEASVFENIIAKSGAMALGKKKPAEAERSTSEEDAESLVRRMSAKVEGALRDSEGKVLDSVEGYEDVGSSNDGMDIDAQTQGEVDAQIQREFSFHI